MSSLDDFVQYELVYYDGVASMEKRFLHWGEVKKRDHDWDEWLEKRSLLWQAHLQGDCNSSLFLILSFI